MAFFRLVKKDCTNLNIRSIMDIRITNGENKMKKLFILGLLVLGLSSCGSVDSESLQECINGNEDMCKDITTETNKEDIIDLQAKLDAIDACKDGDQMACSTAASYGFTNAPIFYDDLSSKETMTTKTGETFERITENSFEYVKNHPFGSLGTRLLVIRLTITFDDDYSAETTAEYKQISVSNGSDITSWTKIYVTPGNETFANKFKGFVTEGGLEWLSLDAKSVYLENTKLRVR